MKSPKVTKRDWKIKDEKKDILVKKNTLNFDKLFASKFKDSKNIQESEKEIKLTEEDERFLEELEKKNEEAKLFQGNFNEKILTKIEYKESKENISYENNVNDLKILENLNINNYTRYVNHVFNNFEKRRFNGIKKLEKKEAFFEKARERKIYKKIKLIHKSKRTLLLKKNSKNEIVEIKNLNKIYENKKKNSFILKDINLTIKKGDFVILVGPSGSGKTTLMNIISGIDNLTYGEIIINDVNISKMNEKELTRFRLNNIGYIFQNYGLIPNLTVEENISIGGYMSFLSKKERKNIKYDNYFNEQDVKKIIKSLGLEHVKDKMPYQLSGGQKQRVSIARAIIKKPDILLFDDCLSAVDTETEEKILKNLVKLTKDKTTIIVSHRVSSAKNADTIIVLEHGKVIQKGNHESLVNTDGYYKELYTKQLSEKEMH